MRESVYTGKFCTRALGALVLVVGLSGCMANRSSVPTFRPDPLFSGVATGGAGQLADGEVYATGRVAGQLTDGDVYPTDREFANSGRTTDQDVYPTGQASGQLTDGDVYPTGDRIQGERPLASGMDGLIVRKQSPDQDSFSQSVTYANQPQDGTAVQPAAYQYPELSSQGGISNYFASPSPQIGGPGNYDPTRPPMNYADLDIYLPETQTGRIQVGGAYNSDNGLVGQFIIDERNFDLMRYPRSFQDIVDGTAWRGGGQAFRLELVPGSQLQRYLFSISDPYFLNTDWSASASGYYFDRIYYDWSERRVGGRLGLGRRIDQDISITTGLRMENVSLRNPRVNTSTILNDALGRSNLFLGSFGIVRDTRDNQFLATAGDFFSATVSQAFGDYSYTRGDIEYRRYRLIYERPDGSGRHTVSFGTRLGVSGKDTPIFENYYAGGYSSLRGFDFRGVGPMDGDVRVGGRFEWINSVEYMFPVTADDMIKGVVFCDFGTVENSVKLSSANYRVSPGVGLRVHLPAAGFGAPLAFDFGFPVATGDGDEERMFSFYMGMMR